MPSIARRRVARSFIEAVDNLLSYNTRASRRYAVAGRGQSSLRCCMANICTLRITSRTGTYTIFIRSSAAAAAGSVQPFFNNAFVPEDQK